MKQVLNIRLDGEVFEVEDDAYRRLNVFLSRVSQLYDEAPKNAESPEVIERRLVSILQIKPNVIITLKDVEAAIQNINIADNSSYSTKNQWTSNSSFSREAKRVQRSPHDKKIGGVCGGLGVYFEIDPLLVRVGFIVGLFFGLSPFLYLLLWALVPVANRSDPRYF